MTCESVMPGVADPIWSALYEEPCNLVKIYYHNMLYGNVDMHTVCVHISICILYTALHRYFNVCARLYVRVWVRIAYARFSTTYLNLSGAVPVVRDPRSPRGRCVAAHVGVGQHASSRPSVNQRYTLRSIRNRSVRLYY